MFSCSFLRSQERTTSNRSRGCRSPASFDEEEGAEERRPSPCAREAEGRRPEDGGFVKGTRPAIKISRPKEGLTTAVASAERVGGGATVLLAHHPLIAAG